MAFIIDLDKIPKGIDGVCMKKLFLLAGKHRASLASDREMSLLRVETFYNSLQSRLSLRESEGMGATQDGLRLTRNSEWQKRLDWLMVFGIPHHLADETI